MGNPEKTEDLLAPVNGTPIVQESQEETEAIVEEELDAKTESVVKKIRKELKEKIKKTESDLLATQEKIKQLELEKEMANKSAEERTKLLEDKYKQDYENLKLQLIKQQVVIEKNLNPELMEFLIGSTKEEIEESANKLLKHIVSKPLSTPSVFQTSSVSVKAQSGLTKEQAKEADKKGISHKDYFAYLVQKGDIKVP